jgi:hypothetical protein
MCSAEVSIQLSQVSGLRCLLPGFCGLVHVLPGFHGLIYVLPGFSGLRYVLPGFQIDMNEVSNFCTGHVCEVPQKGINLQYLTSGAHHHVTV